VRLFKSYRQGIPDGEQRRDFIYVDDVIAVILWFLNKPDIRGIYNVGTGSAGSFRKMIEAMFEALGRPPHIEYVDMPDTIRDSYQYFTQAEAGNLRKIGCDVNFTPLQIGVHRYVTEFLNHTDPYR
jgi:ADP-L-glycero-D-manno-heptose 6-epimerase